MTTTKHRFLIGAMAMLMALACHFAVKPQEEFDAKKKQLLGL